VKGNIPLFYENPLDPQSMSCLSKTHALNLIFNEAVTAPAPGIQPQHRVSTHAPTRLCESTPLDAGTDGSAVRSPPVEPVVPSSAVANAPAPTPNLFCDLKDVLVLPARLGDPNRKSTRRPHAWFWRHRTAVEKEMTCYYRRYR
jgi:hypothetical protein